MCRRIPQYSPAISAMITHPSGVVFADNGNTANVYKGKPAQIMDQTIFGVFKLPLAGPTVKLEVHFINHPQA
jgi:hypothetical protein